MSQKADQQIETIRDMMAKGVLSIEQNGEKVTFRSFAEMRQTLAWLERERDGKPLGAVHTPKYSRW